MIVGPLRAIVRASGCRTEGPEEVEVKLRRKVQQGEGHTPADFTFKTIAASLNGWFRKGPQYYQNA